MNNATKNIDPLLEIHSLNLAWWHAMEMLNLLTFDGGLLECFHLNGKFNPLKPTKDEEWAIRDLPRIATLVHSAFDYLRQMEEPIADLIAALDNTLTGGTHNE